MTVTKTKVKAAQKQKGSSVGAPSQHSQPSRKGKKAWRKHVDIGEVESGLEEVRTEERVVGSSVKSKTNDELFSLDAQGDDRIRKNLPKLDRSQLSYNKTLQQRSAIPSVSSRTSAPKKTNLSREDKNRLLRLGKRDRRGLFNAIEDPTKLGQGSALLEPSHAVKESGKYDVWMDDSLPSTSVKALKPDPLRDQIELPAVSTPHPGASYNPPVEAHQSLLELAHEQALEKEQESQRLAAIKEKVEAARRVERVDAEPGVPSGMTVDIIGDDEDVRSEAGGDEPILRKAPARKTKQQRRKAEKQLAEKRAKAETAARKRQLASLDNLKSTSKALDVHLSAKEQVRLRKQLTLQAKLRTTGLVGRRLGKHIVQELAPDVQLGEDLSESLRGLKVEGNLFKDRFLSMQHRALFEPRAPVIPSRRRKQSKMVEKFAWKRFE